MSIVSMPLPRPARALRLEFKRAATPRAAWARLSIALAGTLCWLLLAFLAGVAVLYIQTPWRRPRAGRRCGRCSPARPV